MKGLRNTRRGNNSRRHIDLQGEPAEEEPSLRESRLKKEGWMQLEEDPVGYLGKTNSDKMKARTYSPSPRILGGNRGLRVGVELRGVWCKPIQTSGKRRVEG